MFFLFQPFHYKQALIDFYHVKRIRKLTFHTQKLTIDCSYSSNISQIKLKKIPGLLLVQSNPHYQILFRFQNDLIVNKLQYHKITLKMADLTMKYLHSRCNNNNNNYYNDINSAIINIIVTCM